jgi:enoyl-[acyl-carrier-protein] reductase (NADH)
MTRAGRGTAGCLRLRGQMSRARRVAGPLKTRAASGICHGVELVRMAQKRVPAQRLMDTAEAGRVVAFPIGGAAFGMTGEHNLR